MTGPNLPLLEGGMATVNESNLLLLEGRWALTLCSWTNLPLLAKIFLAHTGTDATDTQQRQKRKLLVSSISASASVAIVRKALVLVVAPTVIVFVCTAFDHLLEYLSGATCKH